MSDYLGNLIGKSFGQVGVVKPRHAPLFAPSPYLTGALAQAAAITPAADEPLLPSRRAWGATEAQPDSAASDAQELPDRGQWLPVSTDAITAFGTADAPFTSPSGLQVAPISAGTPISPSEEPESSASDLSPAPRVRTRRRSDFSRPGADSAAAWTGLFARSCLVAVTAPEYRSTFRGRRFRSV